MQVLTWLLQLMDFTMTCLDPPKGPPGAPVNGTPWERREGGRGRERMEGRGREIRKHVV